MKSCLLCERATLTQLKPGSGLMQTVCSLSSKPCGEGCGQFVARITPLADPRGETYSAAWLAVCEARHVCRMVRPRKHTDYLAGIRQKRGEEAAKSLERRARAEWRRRADWMTPDELEWSRYV